MLLPAGNWTLTVTAKNQTGGSNITTATFQSLPTLRTTLTSANAQETSIGGDDVTFTFNVTVKSAGSVVEAYLLLASGGYTFDARNALLSDNVTTNVSVAGNGAYTGAENITLPSITTAPAYVTMNLAATGEIRQDLLTLTLTPYATLIPGTYTGSYGFGVFG
jgi:hypothetical protein